MPVLSEMLPKYFFNLVSSVQSRLSGRSTEISLKCFLDPAEKGQVAVAGRFSVQELRNRQIIDEVIEKTLPLSGLEPKPSGSSRFTLLYYLNSGGQNKSISSVSTLCCYLSLHGRIPNTCSDHMQICVAAIL